MSDNIYYVNSAIRDAPGLVGGAAWPLWRPRALCFLLALLSAPLGGCRRVSAPPSSRIQDSDSTSREVVIDTFEQLYPIFLQRRLSPRAKTSVWREYRGKWVCWTGTLISRTANGATFRHIPSTVTFDVSLWLEPPGQQASARLTPGQRVTYTGRLDSYDDVLRTFYLVHGEIIATEPGHAPSAQPNPTQPRSRARTTR